MGLKNGIDPAIPSRNYCRPFSIRPFSGQVHLTEWNGRGLFIFLPINRLCVLTKYLVHLKRATYDFFLKKNVLCY